MQPVAPAPQALPHAPQLFGSSAIRVQVPLQLVRNGAHIAVQLPIWHASLAPQPLPHPPQFFGSVWVLAQLPLQTCSPRPGHWHAPLLQRPLPQSMPQPPQLPGLVEGLVHTPLQVM